MRKTVVLALFAISCILPLSAASVDLQNLLRETQKVRQSGEFFDVVWWIPTEYWGAFLEQNPRITKEQRDAFVQVLDPYLVVAVVRMKTGVFGGVQSQPREEIVHNLQVRANQRVLSLLKMDELSADASNFFLMMKPALANSLGELGKGMQFVVFSNRDDGQAIVDPLKPGSLEVVFFGKVYRWRLPLGSFLPPMKDPTTGEVFPGNYLFNPFTGDRLEASPEKGKTDQGKTPPKEEPAAESGTKEPAETPESGGGDVAGVVGPKTG